jgi:anhydro-N-acetylmuramic acid kinase
MNSYHVIGLMSGTSLDGVDLAFCRFTYKNDNWIYKILNTTTLIYEKSWLDRLKNLPDTSASHFVRENHAYGKYLGSLIKNFIYANDLRPDFVSSHGHTIFHQPQEHLSFQLGDGAYLAAAAGLPVVCDFRTLDIALGGQGAPLVPIGDRLLFPQYDYCLNLGGIGNISFEDQGRRVAFDTCACNMLLNSLANECGLPYDDGGQIARQGKLNQPTFDLLNQADFFAAPHPKSLGKEWVDANSMRTLQQASASLPDKLHTASHHIALQIAQAIQATQAALAPTSAQEQPRRGRILLTGGGAFNSFLVELIRHYLGTGFEVVVPEPELVNFKEALVFAFLGVLRWRQQVNCLSSATGASQDNVGGAVYFN